MEHEWRLSPLYFVNKQNMAYDFAWAESCGLHRDIPTLSVTGLPARFNPKRATLVFRQPYDHSGTWVDESTLGAKDITLYKTPNSELLEALDVGFRGLSGAVAVDESQQSLLGMFIRRGGSVIKERGDRGVHGAGEAEEAAALKPEIAGMSADNLALYNLLFDQFAALSGKFDNLKKTVLTKNHLVDIHQDVGLRRGVFLPATSMMKLTAQPSHLAAEVIQHYNEVA